MHTYTHTHIHTYTHTHVHVHPACTGESVYTQLQGSSVDVNVRLDRSSVKLENTFIGLSTQRYQGKEVGREGRKEM